MVISHEVKKRGTICGIFDDENTISPKRNWEIGIEKKGASYIENVTVLLFYAPILLGCVWNSRLVIYAIFMKEIF